MTRLLLFLAAASSVFAQDFTITGDWSVQIGAQTLTVAPLQQTTVEAEPYPDIPVFNPKAAGWARGVRLAPLRTMETTAAYLLEPGSFNLRLGDTQLERGVDYDLDDSWATLGRLPAGRIKPGDTVLASYRYSKMRIDAIIRTADGRIILRQGDPRVVSAPIPAIAPGEQRLANIFLPRKVDRLQPDHLFPILETAYPEPPPGKPSPTIARIRAKLAAGGHVRILAWGDSVTDGAYLANKNTERWQEQFAARLRKQFPRADIELLTQAWGGRNTGTYLAEPPGSPHNYKETVLALKPDVIISEFVNDASLKPPQVEERYTKLLADFKQIGAEWIILTPHYVRPEWMQLTSEREIDNDPRPYVAGLREFAANHDVALADASLRWGRLWRQGIPYLTLLVNSINHPNPAGQKLFADALMQLFQ